MTEEEKINTLNYLDEEKAKEYYFDFVNYHNDWRKISSKSELRPKFMIDYPQNGYFGYVPNQSWWDKTMNWWSPYSTPNIKDVKLDIEDLEALNNIKKLCDENGISLLLYKTPFDGVDDINMSYLAAVWKWAEENNVEYVDFFKEAHSLDYYMQVHQDSYHAFVGGASIITTRLAEKIESMNVDFQHHSDSTLDSIYCNNEQTVTVQMLSEEHNPRTYFKRLANNDGLLLVRYVKNENKIIDDTITAMRSLGFEDFDGTDSLYAILYRGQLITSSNDPIINYQLGDRTITLDEVGINCNGLVFEYDSIYLSLGYYADEGYFIDKYIDTRGVFWDVLELDYRRWWE